MRSVALGLFFGVLIFNFFLAVTGVIEPRQAGFNALYSFIGVLAVLSLVGLVRLVLSSRRKR